MKPYIGIVLFLTTPAHSEVSLDRFLSGAERCEREGQSDFANFREDIVKKYRNDFGTSKANINKQIKVRIPGDVADGIGVAKPTNVRGKWTRIIVPLQGSWRGLKLREVEFQAGNENGVQAWIFRFDAPIDDVVREFDKDVKDVDRAIRSDPDNLDFGSAKIRKDVNGIVCDWST